MQFANSSQNLWSNSKTPVEVAPRLAGIARRATVKPEQCGWYDSSFDLCHGLEVVEQDDDTLYQLWELSRK